MAQRFATASIKTSVNISPEFHKLCREHRIRFSEAMKVGISILLAERGLVEYDNKLNIVRRVEELKKKAGEYAQKASDLENGNKRNSSNTEINPK